MEFERLGPYRIGRRIGRGGMGEVFEAEHEGTAERVAVKVLNPALAVAEGFRERFEAEIESLKKLHHPNIVRLFGYGEQDGFLFYSMELVDGFSLEQELSNGRRFNWREITQVAIQVCQALKHAHDHGVIHRDLKPANLLMTSDGQIKLLDFGIARLFGGTSLTSGGGVLGTADYMSPEQADGRPVTARCDQYSLGGVLYALASGRPPFLARNLPELLQLQRFAEPEPVRRYAAEVPEELEQIIQKMLSKDPDDRFPDTKVLARHLAAMERFLSRPVADDEFRLSGETGLSGSTELNRPLGETRVAEPSDDEELELEQSFDGSDLHTSTPRTEAHRRELTAGGAREASPPAASQNRFTTIEEERRRERQRERRLWTPANLQIAAWIAALAMVVVTLWWMTRPMSAEELYSRIAGAAQSEHGSLLDVSADIDEFMERFPEHDAAREIAFYQEEAQLIRMERKLRAKSRIISTGVTIAPIERIYIEAMHQFGSHPDRAAILLRSIIALYDADHTLEPDEQHCVTLAKRQLTRLEDRMAGFVPDERQSITDRLDRAEALYEQNPQQARKIWQAIVDVYREKTWADDLVEKAEHNLAASASMDRTASTQE